ncbi:UNVERIFIED_CONTAM: endoglucanase [Streptomyces graminofaciens]
MPRAPHPRPRRLSRPAAAAALAAALAATLFTPSSGIAAEAAAPAATAGSDPSPVRVNQVGYLTAADKIATVVAASTSPLSWQLRGAGDNAVVASGTTRVHGSDPASGDHVHQADFSSVTRPGDYRLSVDGAGSSVAFTIQDKALYPQLGREAMQYFYFHRMGTPVEGQYLQHSAHAHAALHPGDSSVPCYNNWCGGERLNAAGSWADAGDFGIYPVNHAISAWTLLNLYERDPAAYGDGSLPVPERGNGRPDLLDEVEYGSRFMSGMLPSTGLASHKVHNHTWSAFPVTDVGAENALARSAMPPSTNATYAVARTNAQLARVLRRYDPARADALWASARTAWQRAEAMPDVDYAVDSDAEGGGDYPDTKNSDDRYAAAAELYLTAHQRADGSAAGYRSAVTGSPHYGQVAQFDWAEVATAGTLSLLTVAADLPAADIARMRGSLTAFADSVVTTLNGEGYPALIPGSTKYPWGSNSFIANRMLLLGTAHDLTDDVRYLKAMHRAMDYLMGNNAMRLSYITGYGEYAESDLHDRLAWGAYPGTPYPKGWLSGGPNNENINDPATPTGRPAAKSYAGPDTAPGRLGLQGEHHQLERAAGLDGDVPRPHGGPAVGRPGPAARGVPALPGPSRVGVLLGEQRAHARARRRRPRRHPLEQRLPGPPVDHGRPRVVPDPLAPDAQVGGGVRQILHGPGVGRPGLRHRRRAVRDDLVDGRHTAARRHGAGAVRQAAGPGPGHAVRHLAPRVPGVRPLRDTRARP